MTYCVAVSLDNGFVFTSDSRTNAGIDQVSTCSKLFRFDDTENRSIAFLSPGILASTQCVIEQIHRDIREKRVINLNTIDYLSDTADYIGDILSSRIRRYSENEQAGFSPEATMIVAGQIFG
jgi:putative proteasome-type protease